MKPEKKMPVGAEIRKKDSRTLYGKQLILPEVAILQLFKGFGYRLLKRFPKAPRYRVSSIKLSSRYRYPESNTCSKSLIKN